MKVRKILSLLLVATIAATSFVACGNNDSDPNVESNPGQKDAVLDFMWFSDGIEGEVTQKLVEEYQVEHPNVQIRMTEVPFNDFENKLRVSLTGGAPPALARMVNVGVFKDKAISLNDYLDGDKFKDQFNQSLQPYYIYDGDIKAAPTDVTANGLIYNKTAFDKAGVQVPTSPDDIWTVEEWIDAMKTVVEKSDVRYGLVIDKTTHRFATLLYGQGGQIISDDQQSIVINNEAGVRAVDLMKRLHDEKISPDSVWVGSENPNNMFRTGQVGMHLAGSWMMTNYRDNVTDFEWGVTYMPVGTQRSSVPGGKYIMAFKDTGVEKESAEFIDFFTSKESNEKYCLESMFMSPRKDCANIEYDFASEYFAIFANELENSSKAPAVDWSHPTVSNAIKQELLDGISAVISGKESSQEMLDRVAAVGQEALDDSK